MWCFPVLVPMETASVKHGNFFIKSFCPRVVMSVVKKLILKFILKMDPKTCFVNCGFRWISFTSNKSRREK